MASSTSRAIGLIWHRTEFRDKPEERVDRAEMAKLIGVSLDGLGNLRSRYPQDYPKAICSHGRQSWYSRTESMKFGAWLRDLKEQGVGLNHGYKGPARSPLAVAESEVAHLEGMLADAKDAETKHKLKYDKARKRRESVEARLSLAQERVKIIANGE